MPPSGLSGPEVDDLLARSCFTGRAIERAVEYWGRLPTMSETRAISTAIRDARRDMEPTGPATATRLTDRDEKRGTEVWRITCGPNTFLVAWNPGQRRVVTILPQGFKVPRAKRLAAVAVAA